MHAVSSSPHIKTRTNSEGKDAMNFAPETRRAASHSESEAQQPPSRLDDIGYSIHCSLSISRSEDSSIGSAGNGHKSTLRAPHGGHRSFILISEPERTLSRARAKSDGGARDLGAIQRPLPTVESGIALADLAAREDPIVGRSSRFEQPDSSTEQRSPRSPHHGPALAPGQDARSPGGSHSSTLLLPPLHPGSGRCHASPLPSPQETPTVSTDELAGEPDPNQASLNNKFESSGQTHRHRSFLSSDSYYSADAGKHGFLTHHAPADSTGSLVFQCAPGQEAPTMLASPPLPQSGAPCMFARALENERATSPRCILPYQERKRLMALGDEGQAQTNGGAECFLQSEEDDEVEGQIRTTLADSGHEASGKKAEEGEGGPKEEETAVMYGQPKYHVIERVGPNEAASFPMPGREESGASDTASDTTGVSGGQPPAAANATAEQTSNVDAKTRKKSKGTKIRKMISKIGRFRVIRTLKT